MSMNFKLICCATVCLMIANKFVSSLNCDGSYPKFTPNNIVRKTGTRNEYYKIQYVNLYFTQSDGSCTAPVTYAAQKCGSDGTSVDATGCLNPQIAEQIPEFNLECPGQLETKSVETSCKAVKADGSGGVICASNEACPGQLAGGWYYCRIYETKYTTVKQNQCSPNTVAQESHNAFTGCIEAGHAMAQQNVAGELHSYARFVLDLSQCYDKVCQCRQVPRELMQFTDNDGPLWTVHSGNHIRYLRSPNLDDAKNLELMSRTLLSAITLRSKVVVPCPDTLCQNGQYQTAQPTDFACKSVCSDCVPPTWGYGKNLTCFQKSDCPKNSSSRNEFDNTFFLPTTHRNTMCKCNPNLYVTQNHISSSTFLPSKSYKLYQDGLFESHIGQCTPCKSISECDNTTQYLDGCKNGEDHECVCKTGYYFNEGECKACKNDEYKQADTKEVKKSCQQCPYASTGELTLTGAATQDDCYCGDNYFLKEDLDVPQCVPCYTWFPKKPYRDQFKSKNCTECPPRHKFDIQEIEKGCQRWEDIGMVMTIQCINPTWRISPFYDQFIIDSISSITETLNPAHDLWKRAYANVNAKIWKITDLFKRCSNCEPGKYRIACGGPVRINANFGFEKYQIALKINGTVALKTLDAQFESSEDYDKICPDNKKSPLVEILREGKCEKCTSCGIGNYVDGCGANEKGSCKTCEVCQTEVEILKDAKEYLHHPNPNQCDEPVTQDCERKKCDKSKKEVIIGFQAKYKIGIECGEHNVKIWDETTPRLENVEIQTRIITGKGKFEQGRMERYCPSGYYVNPDCFKEDEDWNPQCCMLCKLHDALQKRSSDYRECPGDEDSDTQKYVERCENGFYETTESGTETSICKPCTTCSFS